MKKNYSATRKPYAPKIENRIIELHQNDKMGAQAIADKLTKEFKTNFSRAPVGKRLKALKAEGKIKDIPYLKVGPYHTNTIAGLELAIDILRRRKNNNKQIFMITDGKPTCMKVGINYYKNAFGLDPKILNKTYNLASVCKKNNIRVNTFMIASDPYLMEFVEKFTEINDGSAYFADLNDLGSMILKDYSKNKIKKY